MELTIFEQGNYFCYLNSDYERDYWSYACTHIGDGWFGFKSIFSTNRAEIKNRENEIVARIAFSPRLFRPHVLQIEFLEKENKMNIHAEFLSKLAYYPFTFKLNQKSYRFEAL